MPLPGEKMKLKYQAPESVSNLFIRATLRNAEDIVLSESPASLIHVDKGLYTNNNKFFPDTSEVKATIEIFKDAGFTQVNRKFSSVIQVVEVDSGSGSVEALGRDAAIEITFEDEQVETLVEEQPEIEIEFTQNDEPIEIELDGGEPIEVSLSQDDEIIEVIVETD